MTGKAKPSSSDPNVHVVFHYPPELLALLGDTIPLLCRSKPLTIDFFVGAGTPRSLIADLNKQVQSDPDSISKYKIARTALQRLNEKKDEHLRELREVVRRVVEFENFDVCWPSDILKAKGLVAEIRALVNVKDSFTRMREEADRQSSFSQKAAKEKLDALERQQAMLEGIRRDFFALFAENDAHKRGKQLEGVLNRLFSSEGMLVREAFTIKGQCREGVIEQIDGVVEIDNHLYLVEFKWWNTALGPGEVSQHLVRVYSRGSLARGIFFSYTKFTDAAITVFREAIAGGALVVAGTLEELVSVLNRAEDGDSVASLLREKIQAAILDKQPYKTR